MVGKLLKLHLAVAVVHLAIIVFISPAGVGQRFEDDLELVRGDVAVAVLVEEGERLPELMDLVLARASSWAPHHRRRIELRHPCKRVAESQARLRLSGVDVEAAPHRGDGRPGPQQQTTTSEKNNEDVRVSCVWELKQESCCLMRVCGAAHASFVLLTRGSMVAEFLFLSFTICLNIHEI